MPKLHDEDDKTLITRAQQGDDRAFEELLRRYYDRIFAMACSWCLNRDTAQDVTQAVCMAIAKNIHGFKHDSTFLTWAYRITINTAKNVATGTRYRHILYQRRAGRAETENGIRAGKTYHAGHDD